jgi:Mg-chelatase subunit ChlD
VPTRDSRVIYLPLTVAERCDPARQRIDVILVIDASTSMRTPTRAGRPKIDAALDAAARFLERLGLPEDQAGLVAFNAQATVLSRLSGDRAALLRALGTLRTQEFTRIHLGMDLARDLVLAGEHKGENLPAIVLLTDGRSNPDPSQMALDAAAAAKAAGIRVFTVGLGQDVEPDVLRAMASRPEDYYPAGDGEDLAEIYRSIAVSLPCPIAGWRPAGR